MCMHSLSPLPLRWPADGPADTHGESTVKSEREKLIVFYLYAKLVHKKGTKLISKDIGVARAGFLVSLTYRSRSQCHRRSFIR